MNTLLMNATKPLVIKKWKAQSEPLDEEGNFVEIIGRQGGLIDWLMALLKLDPETSIKISGDRVIFKRASLSGNENRMIPIMSICSTYYGFHKPWGAALAIFLVCTVFGSQLAVAMDSGLAAFAFILIGAVVAVIYYSLNRTLTLGFIEHSGVSNSIRFKRSVIEGKEINSTQGAYICQLVEYLIESKRGQL